MLSPYCVSGSMLDMAGNALMSKTLDLRRNEGRRAFELWEKEAPQSPSIVRPH